MLMFESAAQVYADIKGLRTSLCAHYSNAHTHVVLRVGTLHGTFLYYRFNSSKVILCYRRLMMIHCLIHVKKGKGKRLKRYIFT